MGVYDSIFIPCPNCGHYEEFQSKGADQPLMREYLLGDDIPPEVIRELRRYERITCDLCDTHFILTLDSGEIKLWYNYSDVVIKRLRDVSGQEHIGGTPMSNAYNTGNGLGSDYERKLEVERDDAIRQRDGFAEALLASDRELSEIQRQRDTLVDAATEVLWLYRLKRKIDRGSAAPTEEYTYNTRVPFAYRALRKALRINYDK